MNSDPKILTHTTPSKHREIQKGVLFCFLLSVSFVVQFSANLRAGPAAGEALYKNDFEKTPEGDPPADLGKADHGEFKVKTVDGNKVLELPGDPLEKFSMLFGPEDQPLLCVCARIYGTATGKRTPEFGVGLADTNGYRLALMPATNSLQIYKHEDVVATVPYTWISGTWTVFRLQVRKTADGKYVVEGKAWPHGTAEPKEWAVSFTETQEAPKGRATIWGSPYASTPIRFDDLLVTKPAE